MAPSDDSSHIVMLPFMAHGHLILFLALTKQIRRRSRFDITIASTPVNVRHLRSSAVADPTLANVDFAELAFCTSDHGLPFDAESTKNMPPTQMTALLRVAELQSSAGKPCRAYGTSAYVSLWLHLPHRGTESCKFVLPVLPERCLFDKSRLLVMIREADGEDMWSRFLLPQFDLSLSSSGWLCNTSEEFEPIGTAALRNLVKLMLWTIGPLLPDAIVRDDDSSGSLNFISEHRPEKPLGITSERCIEFLDAHPPGSAVYVCFGSQNTITIKAQHL